MDILIGDLFRDRRGGFLAIRSIYGAHALGRRWDGIFASHGAMRPVYGIEVCAQLGGRGKKMANALIVLSYYPHSGSTRPPPHLKGCITAE